MTQNQPFRRGDPRRPPAAPKRMRHFYCMDELWKLFEELAEDFNCSVDYLINEAMRGYARNRRRTASSASPAPEPPRPPPPLPIKPPAVSPPTRGSPRPEPASVSPGDRVRTTPSPRPAPAPAVVLIFNGQRITISKDQFVIGRTSRGVDLVIRDGNISRKHAVVLRRNGTYYIKDLGSTNGIDYRGTRIDNKRIDEGDVFRLCDHELAFSYRNGSG